MTAALFAVTSLPVVLAGLQCYNSTLNTTLSTANASGIFPFEVGYPAAQDSQTAAETKNISAPAWAYTVNTTGGEVVNDFWYSTGGDNYSDDLGIGYDACAWIITGGIPMNTIQLGQDDPGDCSAMLSQSCRDAITSRLESSATKWTTYASPPPYSNLSAGVLPTLCSYILDDLGDEDDFFPRECRQEFADSSDKSWGYHPIPLTGHNDSVMDNTCTMLDGDGRTFRNIDRTGAVASEQYRNFTRTVYPALTVYFTVANAERRQSGSFWTGSSNAQISCLRAKDFAAGSEVSLPLEKGEPYTRRGLAKNAVVGIAVGVVLGGLALVAVTVWLWRRRGKRERNNLAEPKAEEVAQIDGAAYYELHPVDRKLELADDGVKELEDSSKMPEMDGTAGRSELDGGTGRVEL